MASYKLINFDDIPQRLLHRGDGLALWERDVTNYYGHLVLLGFSKRDQLVALEAYVGIVKIHFIPTVIRVNPPPICLNCYDYRDRHTTNGKCLYSFTYFKAVEPSDGEPPIIDTDLNDEITTYGL